MNRTDGFTLTEMLIALTLIGILTAVSMPAIQAASARHSVVTAVDRVAAKLSVARSTAVRYGRTARLRIEPTDRRAWVEADTTLGGSGVMDTIGAVADFTDENLQMSSTRTLLCFEPRGIATDIGSCPAGDLRVVFQRGEYADTLETTTLGKIVR